MNASEKQEGNRSKNTNLPSGPFRDKETSLYLQSICTNAAKTAFRYFYWHPTSYNVALASSRHKKIVLKIEHEVVLCRRTRCDEKRRKTVELTFVDF